MEEKNKLIKYLKDQVRKQEKLASLGMMSAGIAHEIQNPLNFVINFSKTSTRMLQELEEMLEEVSDKLSAETQEDLKDLLEDLHHNMNKIEENGNRASSIVRGILLHSRGKDDTYYPTELPALVKEYIWLSYHSMRANYKGFNLSIRESYDTSIPPINIIPQDFSRVVLNLMNNACYAVYIKEKNVTGNYKPTVCVSLLREGDRVKLVIEDNGIGMSKEVYDKLFTPFFTTKPVGEGTGLGLSITQSIIEEKHGGSIEVETSEGEFTRFTVSLPIK